MDDSEEDFEGFVEVEDEPASFMPGRFTWITPVILLVQVIEEIGQAIVDGLNGFKMALAVHQNYKLERDEFVASAGRELETITEE